MPQNQQPPGLHDVEICDAHHHLYDTEVRRYSIDDLRRDAAGLPVVRSVYVECGQHYLPDGPAEFRPTGETAWAASIAGGGPVAGIVGYADLSAPNIAAILSAHCEAGLGLFRGIRQGAAWDADPAIAMSHVTTRPGMAAEASYARGVAALAARGLICDMYVYFHQLAEVAALARRVPEATIVLNHLGGLLGVASYASAAVNVRQVWRAGLPVVAACPNVLVKVGGLGRPLAGTGWEKAAVQPAAAEVAAYWRADVLWAIGLFGPSRCIFESNFPVDRKSFSYRTCWQALGEIVSEFSPGERRAMFHDNAVRVYRLGDQP